MKVALVTGTNSGFGLLITLELLKSGFHVIATMRTIENSTELVEQARALQRSDHLEIYAMDVTRSAEIACVYQSIKEKHPQIHVLVNNAGYCQGGFLEELTEEDWINQYEVNVHGVFRVTKAFLPLLKKTPNAQIINISSVSGYVGFPGMSPYCSSKFALEGFSESLRLELMPEGISVSLIEPASYKTKIWERGLSGINPEKIIGSSFKQSILTHAKQAAADGSDPLEVAKLTSKICNSKRPKFRYPIGKGASLLSLAKRYLPWSLIEYVVAKKLARGLKQ